MTEFQSSKPQKNSKLQAAKQSLRTELALEFRVWRFSGVWRLALGVCSCMRPRIHALLLMGSLFAAAAYGSPDSSFAAGLQAYRAAEYTAAADAFRQAAALDPSSGALQNLGLAEWELRRPGAAILAWERALWLDPFNMAARGNLHFARKAAQLEASELTWYEVVSTWLPVNWWAWLAGSSFWVAVAAILLPGIFRQRKAAWHQAVAALGVTVFLLSVPAHVGVHTRSRIGFIIQKDTPLRLTPTQEGQTLTRLAAGEPARWQRTQGNYVLIHTSRALGWVEQAQLGLICPRSAVGAQALKPAGS